MALNEFQWGRILAVAWKHPSFGTDLEKDPAGALQRLKTSNPPLVLASEHQALGLNDPAPFHLESIHSPSEFSGDPARILHEIITTGRRTPSGPVVEVREDSWFLEPARNGNATQPGDTLTLAQWARIYARLWMDFRINQPGFTNTLPSGAIYTPQRGYDNRFAKDPTDVIEDMALSGIPYTRRQTRLFALVQRPTSWSAAELDNVIDTGRVNGFQLRWMVRKCC
jgi:hypothetical protein